MRLIFFNFFISTLLVNFVHVYGSEEVKIISSFSSDGSFGVVATTSSSLSLVYIYLDQNRTINIGALDNSVNFGMGVAASKETIIVGDGRSQFCVKQNPNLFPSSTDTTPAIYVYKRSDSTHAILIGLIFQLREVFYWQPYELVPNSAFPFLSDNGCPLDVTTIGISTVEDNLYIILRCSGPMSLGSELTYAYAIRLNSTGLPIDVTPITSSFPIGPRSFSNAAGFANYGKYFVSTATFTGVNSARSLSIILCDITIKNLINCVLKDSGLTPYSPPDAISIFAHSDTKVLVGISYQSIDQVTIYDFLIGPIFAKLILNSTYSLSAYVPSISLSNDFIIMGAADTITILQYEDSSTEWIPYIFWPNTLVQLESDQAFVVQHLDSQIVVVSRIGGNTIASFISSCEAGHYSTLNQTETLSSCEPCYPGTFKDEVSVRPCNLCLPSYYASNFSSSECTECSKSDYCPSGAIRPLPIAEYLVNNTFTLVQPSIPERQSFDFNGNFYIFVAPFYFGSVLFVGMVGVVIVILYYTLFQKSATQPHPFFKVIGLTTILISIERYQFKKIGMDIRKPTHYAKYATLTFLLTLLIIMSLGILLFYAMNLLDRNSTLNLSAVTTVQPLYYFLNDPRLGYVFNVLDSPGFNITVDLYGYNGICASANIGVNTTGMVYLQDLEPSFYSDEFKCQIKLSLSEPTVVSTDSTLLLRFNATNLYIQYINYTIITTRIANENTESFPEPLVNNIGNSMLQGSITPFTFMGETTSFILRGQSVVEITSTVQVVEVCGAKTNFNLVSLSVEKNTTWACGIAKASTKVFTFQDLTLSDVASSSYFSANHQGLDLVFAFKKTGFFFNTRVSRFVSAGAVLTLCLAVMYFIYTFHRILAFPLLRLIHFASRKFPESSYTSSEFKGLLNSADNSKRYDSTYSFNSTITSHKIG